MEIRFSQLYGNYIIFISHGKFNTHNFMETIYYFIIFREIQFSQFYGKV